MLRSLQVIVLVGTAAAAGCVAGPAPTPTRQAGHGHPTEGPNAKGPLAGFELDNVEYGHAEITLSDAGDEVIVYFVDEKAQKKITAPPEKISGVKIKFEKPMETRWIALKHDPKRSSDKGLAFVGSLPEKFTIKSNKELTGEITATIDGKEFSDKDFPEKH